MMRTIWSRIEAWLARHLPALEQDLQSGATADQLDMVEQVLGVQFPEVMRAAYQIHNGQLGDAAPLMGEWQLLSLEDLQGQWELMQDLHIENPILPPSSAAGPSPIRADWWNSKWIPIAYNGAGDLMCVDLDPAPGGEVGQVITVWHAQPERSRIASSVQVWLEHFAAALEQGDFIVEADELVSRGDEATD
jgi:cell wall assembly regulator SMI1